MKVVLQAIISSMAIHVVYFVGMMVVSYIKTRNYKPDFASAWDQAETLQSEVVIRKASSPALYFFTFVAVAVICGILLFFI